MLFLVDCLVALTLALSVTLSKAQEGKYAPSAYNNPKTTYAATLLTKNTTNVGGTITGTPGPNGEGVTFNVHFFGFPDESLGPFKYHIHLGRVPANGDCTAALGHLDPYNRGAATPCNNGAPETCQVGDLSGKHGEIVAGPGITLQENYTDNYLSTEAGSTSFFGNRSIVVHYANNTILNCGNFYLVSAATLAPSSASIFPSASALNWTSSPLSTASAQIPVFTGAAIPARGLGTNAILLALGAFLL